MLRHTRWYVAKATSLTEATARLSQQHFHVVLSQHSLQQGTWMDVADAVKATQPHAAVIVLCRAADQLDDRSFRAYDVLPLPCNPTDLYVSVTSAWWHAIQREQNPAAAASMRA